VKYGFLPEHIKSNFALEPTVEWEQDSTSEEDSNEDEEQKENRAPEIRYVVTATPSSVSNAELLDLLSKSPPFLGLGLTPRVVIAPVPALAPTTAEQADQWSRDHWPVTFRNTNPYGPHPSIIQRNAQQIEKTTPFWLDIANSAGQENARSGLGEGIGCVIVDGSQEPHKAIAIAGDCRWRSPAGEPMEKEGCGNVMGHCVQRAIAMVAKKRLRVAGKEPDDPMSHLFSDSPINPLEAATYSVDNIAADGYLCVNLDIYLSHEPCVMCCMAILHSRFARCVIRRRMPLTGGLTAESEEALTNGDADYPSRPPGLGCGMFWRPAELNWKFFAWEWYTEDGDKDGKNGVADHLHA